MRQPQKLTESDILALLQKAVELDGSQREFAQRLGIPPNTLSDMLRCRRPISSFVLAALGIRKVTVLERGNEEVSYERI